MPRQNRSSIRSWGYEVASGGCCRAGGCAGQVEPESRTVRVEVPVLVPCRAPAGDVPAWATASLQKSDSLQTKMRALLAELEQRKGYEVPLLVAVQTCQ